MTVRSLFLAVLVFTLTVTLTVGCSEKQTLATDAESLKKAADEFNRIAQEENAAKQKDKKSKVE